MARANKAALLATSTVRAFGGALPPTMPSADFCVAVRSPYDDFSPVTGTQRRPPEVRSTAFAARPPDLPPRSLMTLDFAIICPLVRPGRPLYPVLVHRAAALLYASFGPRLATTPLRFANPSPPSGWIEDSHLQAVDHARHTKEQDRHRCRSWVSPGAGKRKMVRSVPSGARVTSGQEVPLDAEHHADDVLVVDDVRAGGPCAIRPQDRGALVGRVEVRPHDVHAHVEIRMRVPLRARADLPPAEVRRAGIARAGPDVDRRRDRTFHGHATRRGADRRRRQMLVDQVGRGAVVVDLHVPAVQRGAPLRRPQVLHGAIDAPDRGQLDVRSRREPRAVVQA